MNLFPNKEKQTKETKGGGKRRSRFRRVRLLSPGGRLAPAPGLQLR